MGKFKTFAAIIVIGLCMAGGIIANDYFNHKPMQKIDFILKHMDSRGRLIDYANDIGMSGIDDLGYRIIDEKMVLYYGKVEIELKNQDLMNEELMMKLKWLGITITNDNQGNTIVRYHEENIPKWIS